MEVRLRQAVKPVFSQKKRAPCGARFGLLDKQELSLLFQDFGVFNFLPPAVAHTLVEVFR